MKWNSFRLNAQSLILIFIISLAVLSACSSTPSTATQSYNINIATKAGLGNYLVDSRGMTLYYFTKDTSAKSNASAAIIQNWPVFNPGTISLPATLNSADFATITRDDGMKQVTFKGWPLYYFGKDLVSGDTIGQGVNNVWFIIDPATLKAAPTSTQ
jgi:predicted lipoprotein with Yx(FWY)xxD motif